MNRLFIRRDAAAGGLREGRNPEQINIGVTGLGRSVGTTFVASSLAFYFASMGNSLTFVQCLNPASCDSLFYDKAAMDQRFINREFIDVYRLIYENRAARGVKNIEEGINWILPTPWVRDNEITLDDSQRSRLIHSVRGDVCIYDMEPGKSWDGYLLDMDRIVVVADPLPSRLISAAGRFRMLKQLELSGIRTDWIINRSNSGVDRRQIYRYMKNKNLLWLPDFDSSLIYADEFSCRFSWEDNEIRCKMMEIFTKVSQ